MKEVLRQVTMEMSYLTHITQKQTADNQYTCFVFVCVCVCDCIGKMNSATKEETKYVCVSRLSPFNSCS